MLEWHFLCATLCPLLSEWEPLRRVYLCLLYLLLQILIHIDKVPPNLSLLESWTVPALPASSSVTDTSILYGTLLGSLQYFHVSCTVEPSPGELGRRHCPLDTIHIVHQKMIKEGRIWTCVSQLSALTARLCFLARLRDSSIPWLLFFAAVKAWLEWLSEVEKLMSHCLVEQCNFVWSAVLICPPISGEDLFMVLSEVIL